MKAKCNDTNKTTTRKTEEEWEWEGQDETNMQTS